MKKTRQFFSVLLTLAMLLTLVPAMGVTASAAEPEWETVNTFEELYTAVKDKKEYIKLGQKIDTSSWNEGNGLSMSGSLSFEDKNFVLDLNGKTLNLQTKNDKVYSFIYLANGSLTIKDSSPEKKGTISGYFGSTASGCDYRTIFVGENGSLTLEGGTFSTDGKPYSTATEAIYCRGGSVTVKDGVTIIQRWFHDRGYAKDLDGYGYALHTEGRSKAIIDGGEFIGHVKLSGYQDANGSVQINGGTFRENVQVLYTAKELKTKYDFSAKVTKSFTLYAKWTEKDNSANQIILTIGKKDAQVFGQIKTNDVAPKIVNDRTMLPARFVAENLDAKVEWDGE